MLSGPISEAKRICAGKATSQLDTDVLSGTDRSGKHSRDMYTPSDVTIEVRNDCHNFRTQAG